MRPVDEAGRPLDAEFRVESYGDLHSFVIESRGGPKSGPKSRNPDYAPALMLCLARMKSLGLVINDAFVDSSYTQKHSIPIEDCRLLMDDFPLPIELAHVQDIEQLRLALTSAQGGAGLPDGRQPNRSGAFKRARLVFAPSTPALSLSQLEQALAAGSAVSHETQESVAAGVPSISGPLDRRTYSVSRAEQGFLRDRLFGKQTDAQCAICGRTLPVELLITAHIKPRSHCEPQERLDWRNVVMPACLLGCDALYERGLCSVDSAGHVRVHADPTLGDAAVGYLRSIAGRRCLAWAPASVSYFEWHYRSRFRGVAG